MEECSKRDPYLGRVNERCVHHVWNLTLTDSGGNSSSSWDSHKDYPRYWSFVNVPQMLRLYLSFADTARGGTGAPQDLPTSPITVPA